MRNRQRTTNRGVSREVLIMAVAEVEDWGKSVRGVARAYGISHVTLRQYFRKRKLLKEAGILEFPTVGYYRRRVFSVAQETELSNYLRTASAIYFGLSPREVRKLAFQCAKTYGCIYPEAWNAKEMAGPDWFTAFLKRNPILSIRTPQATSMSRATSFNQSNVSSFFSNLATVLERHAFEARDIWNSDETGIKTVHAPAKVVATKGVKQVGGMTSGERGSLVTLAVAVNAQGNSIPPLFIFPRKRFQTHFICGAPTGSIGTANQSGWMKEEEFLLFLRHFVRHTRASSDSKVLLLLDNHTSHVSVVAIKFCQENGVVLLTFPPHCSHKLQPLDRSVFGPLKKKMNTLMDSWMRSHPGKTATIYDLPGIVAEALPQAATPQNIMAGFRCTGIWPFNDAVFTEADFAPSYVADRPAGTTLPTAALDVPTLAATATAADPTGPVAVSITPADATAAITWPVTTAATGSCSPNPSPLPAGSFSPVAIRPFPKAGPRKSSAKKKKASSKILTDHTIERALDGEEEEDEKKKKKKKKKESTPNKAKRRLDLTPKRKNRPTNPVAQESCLYLVCEEDLATTLPADSVTTYPTPPTLLEVSMNLPVMPMDPVDRNKCTIAQIKSMALRKHVDVLDARVSHVKSSTVMEEMKTCYLEDASGLIMLQLWEDQVGTASAGASYRFTNLNAREFAGKLFLSAICGSTITPIADLQGIPAGDTNPSDDEQALSTVTGQALTTVTGQALTTVTGQALTTVTGQVSGVEIAIMRCCRRCRKTQTNFEAKADFHRCEDCRMLQKTNTYAAVGNGTLGVTGEHGDRDVVIRNSVLTKYLESEGLLHLMLEPQDVEVHFLDGGQFELKLCNDVVIDLNKNVLDATTEDRSVQTMREMGYGFL
ncbi:hypothetical protein SKAU_G00148550 [Synaphobranchus kaupii]|uniref:DDE-1 domain-containing protein n=1 Tax=Synaphobranchus kaupii TaxID=118154 RepID=A0A9Q1FU26_SYNKA|nr:hypothetical protein SKAU_G00148550 [Synaphobranchus kaupii]